MRFRFAMFLFILICMTAVCGCANNLPDSGTQNDQIAVPQSLEQTPSVPDQSAQTPAPQETQARGPVLLGEFSTRIVDNTESRVKNLRLACSAINGKVIQPGEVFSFNGTVGPRTQERGFQMGHVFEGTKKTEAVGGGVCQISSTLFNTARKAGMEIVERHQHKRKVDYVKLGDDATVSYGEMDFRFRNTASQPVKIEAGVVPGRVVVKLWGI